MEAVEDSILTVVDADMGCRLFILFDRTINECARERMSLVRYESGITSAQVWSRLALL